MEDVKLIKPTIELKDEYLDMIKDWKDNNERPNPSTLNLDTSDFPAMIKKLEGFSKGIGLKEGYVEHSTYWLIENNTVIGAVNIRHRLNDYLFRIDGNIGGGIRPSFRGKGYGSTMLSLALDITKDMGMGRVLITCNDDNIISEKTIIKNGGVFESEEVETNGNVVKRFWVDLGH
ncbi:GNAT family N-acetyltransferase [Schnuerera sp. xch1]|uniref:GNAT family N-acetyltransferase n=1 Tax=Schnuerera sp. xch1 TaxID=2874283 RepID=UPI001CBCF89E|nr:GNAT family N-acetyltransferase [Schnuerera sp. xch1]MBZ2174467.1 GNAT family N-acetyltransferase [Schnuerera sp. xch1]